jgi:hypothetical protein
MRSPPGGSTLITSAPRSARHWGPNGPARNIPKSRTFRPWSGWRTAAGPSDGSRRAGAGRELANRAPWSAPVARAPPVGAQGGTVENGGPGWVVRPKTGSSTTDA